MQAMQVKPHLTHSRLVRLHYKMDFLGFQIESERNKHSNMFTIVIAEL